MAGILNFTPGAPKLGMTRKDFPYTSLHGGSLRQTEKTPDPSDIYALPKGTSSDEDSDSEEALNDGASDDDELFGRSEKQKPAKNGMLRTSTHSSPTNGEEDGKKTELSVEPSNIRPGSFTSGRGPGSRNGSQSSQKRKDTDLDDEDVSVAFSQPKKPKKDYGSTNIHKGPVTKPGNPKKVLPKEKAGPVWKDGKSDDMIARGRTPLRIGHMKTNTTDLK